MLLDEDSIREEYMVRKCFVDWWALWSAQRPTMGFGNFKCRMDSDESTVINQA